MSSNLKHTKNYTELGESYQLVLPLGLEGLIPEDESVRLLSHELEELDYTLLYQAYSAKGRNPAVDPKTMFKILTYAYSQNIYSSRRIECAGCSGCPYKDKCTKAKRNKRLYVSKNFIAHRQESYENISWVYKTDIPHEKFYVYEDEEIYCEGIVFSVGDLK